MFFDSHAHITYGDTYDQIDDVLARAKAAKVSHIVNICTDITTLERGIELAKRTPWVFNSGATTPHDVEEEGESAFPHFEKAARDGHLVAIGETGLDYYYEHSNRELQQEFCIRYFRLADALNLPVVIHCRDAFDDLFRLADTHYKGRAILHCFTGTYDEAKRGVDRGWMVSMSGIATFKRSQDLRDTFKKLPLEHLLIETDTPYLAPQTRRGKPNEPAFVGETCQCLADLHGKSLEEVAETTLQNGRRFFGIA